LPTAFKASIDRSTRTNPFYNNKAKAFDLLTSFPQAAAAQNPLITEQSETKVEKDEQKAMRSSYVGTN